MSDFAVAKLTENIIEAGDRVKWLSFRMDGLEKRVIIYVA